MSARVNSSPCPRKNVSRALARIYIWAGYGPVGYRLQKQEERHTCGTRGRYLGLVLLVDY
jgi:hypothetical protein